MNPLPYGDSSLLEVGAPALPIPKPQNGSAGETEDAVFHGKGFFRGRVLVVEDNRVQAFLTRTLLERAQFEVFVSTTGAAALSDAQHLRPDLILLDLELPDLGGREVAQRLKRDEMLRAVPVVYLTGIYRDVQDVIQGLDEGADDYLTKPIQGAELVARVNACMRARGVQKELLQLNRLLRQVHVIGQEVASILDLKELVARSVRLIQSKMQYPYVLLWLRDHEVLSLAAVRGDEAEWMLEAGVKLPLSEPLMEAQCVHTGMSRLMGASTQASGLMKQLPLLAATACIPIRRGENVLGVLQIGSTQRLSFSINDMEALETLSSLLAVSIENARIYAEKEWLATVDGLTGLLNRRTWFEHLNREWDRCRRYNRALSVLVLDVDHFKQVNDVYGHMMGDQALQMVSHLILEALRGSDQAGRLGGDEFVILLPETDQVGAMAVAERVLAGAGLASLTSSTGRVIPLTLSVGAATWPDASVSSATGLLHAADRALYRGKQGGRNRVSL